MINEIWFIHNGICIYHKTLRDPLNPKFTGLRLEEQLFSGFVAALISFSSDQLAESNKLQKISFHESVFEIINVEELLVVLSLNTTYLSEQKLKQSVISLTDEIQYTIQTQEKLKHLRLHNKGDVKPKLLPLTEYKTIFDKHLVTILDDVYMIQDQMIMVDILTLVQLIEEMRFLLDKLKIQSNSIGIILSLSAKAKKILQKIELIKVEPTEELYSLEKEYKKAFQDCLGSIQKDGLLKNGDSSKYILKFMKQNYKILKQFGFEDLFFEEIVITI